MEMMIARPDVPQHYMVLRSIQKRVVVRLPDGTKLADSTKATRLMESGKTLYDPVVYLPAEDACVALTSQSNTTHCPLKGDAGYYSFDSASESHENLAWSYDTVFDFSQPIKGLIAFYSDKVIIEEHPI